MLMLRLDAQADPANLSPVRAEGDGQPKLVRLFREFEKSPRVLLGIRYKDGRCAMWWLRLRGCRSEAGVPEYRPRGKDESAASRFRVSVGKAYSERSRECHASHGSGQAEQVIADDVCEHQCPLALLKE